MSERRRQRRFRVLADVDIGDADEPARTFDLTEISRGGCRLHSTNCTLSEGTSVMLGIGPFREIAGQVVWQRGSEFGLRFDCDLQDSMVEHVRQFLDAAPKIGSAA